MAFKSDKQRKAVMAQLHNNDGGSTGNKVESVGKPYEPRVHEHVIWRTNSEGEAKFSANTVKSIKGDSVELVFPQGKNEKAATGTLDKRYLARDVVHDFGGMVRFTDPLTGKRYSAAKGSDGRLYNVEPLK